MAKKIPIGEDLFALVDDEDYELVSKFNWHKHKSSSYGQYYASSNVKMHRLVMDAKPGEIIDHINGDSLDNRKENLRLCTHSQNQQNTQSRGGSSRYKGVSYNKKAKKWRGGFFIHGKTYYCGSFESEDECARAVDKKRLEICGEFAVLNLPKRKD
jgi:hypothetical protein